MFNTEEESSTRATTIARTIRITVSFFLFCFSEKNVVRLKNVSLNDEDELVVMITIR